MQLSMMTSADYDGNLYTIKGRPDAENQYYIGCELDKVNLETHNSSTIYNIRNEEGNIIPNYTHSMDFDHASNTLYWVCTDSYGYQKIYKLDPKFDPLDEETPTVEKVAGVYFNSLTALAIPFEKADNRDAAGSVMNLTASTPSDDVASTKVNISWINPTKTWRGDELTQLYSVKVARGTRDNVIAEVQANNKVGMQLSYEDASAPAGLTTYYITPCRVQGENGMVDSVKVWSGADVPGEPENVSISYDGDNMDISWQKPTTSRTGKGYDESTLKYNVTRLPDNVQVAEGITATSCKDINLGKYALYSYKVTPVNAAGEGVAATSSTILAGEAYDTPYENNFENEVAASNWQVIDNNSDWFRFVYAGTSGDSWQYYRILLSSYQSCDDYLVSPLIHMEAGKKYRVSSGIILGNTEDTHEFAFTMGKEVTAESQAQIGDGFTNIRATSNGEIRNFEEKTTADEDGDYFVGIHCTSQPSQYGSFFGVNNVKVERIFAKDLAVSAFEKPAGLVAAQENALPVKIKNMGDESVSAYKVQIENADDGSVLGTADMTTALAPDAETTAWVGVTPAADGTLRLRARVVLEGDEYNGNDLSEVVETEVEPAGTAQWNLTVTGENTSESTTTPMNVYFNNSTNEFIYQASEMNQTENARIDKIGFPYSSNEITEPTSEVAVKIYMGNTDKDAYEDNQDPSQWTQASDLTLVYEGNVRIEVGTDLLMAFNLQTPFVYDHTKNLLVQVWKEGTTETEYPALFQVYNSTWDADAAYRSLRYQSNSGEYAYSDKFYAYHDLPVARFALAAGSGVRLLTVGADDFVLRGNMLIANDNVVSLEAYSTNGACVARIHGNASARLQKGLYLVKATLKDGKQIVKKFIVR